MFIFVGRSLGSLFLVIRERKTIVDSSVTLMCVGNIIIMCWIYRIRKVLQPITQLHPIVVIHLRFLRVTESNVQNIGVRWGKYGEWLFNWARRRLRWSFRPLDMQIYMISSRKTIESGLRVCLNWQLTQGCNMRFNIGASGKCTCAAGVTFTESSWWLYRNIL